MTSKDKSIIRLNPNPEGFGETPDTLDAEDFSSELPLQNTHSVYEDDDIGLYVGLWDTDSMVEKGGPYACDEFMWLIEGECQIRNNRTGEIETVKAFITTYIQITGFRQPKRQVFLGNVKVETTTCDG